MVHDANTLNGVARFGLTEGQKVVIRKLFLYHKKWDKVCQLLQSAVVLLLEKKFDQNVAFLFPFTSKSHLKVLQKLF
jgi:hypothetical protein